VYIEEENKKEKLMKKIRKKKEIEKDIRIQMENIEEDRKMKMDFNTAILNVISTSNQNKVEEKFLIFENKINKIENLLEKFLERTK
jgi:hypothetical protein